MPSTKHPWRYRTTLFQERSKQRSEDVPVLVSKESDLDGDMEHSVLEASRHELAVSDSLTVLLRSDMHYKIIVFHDAKIVKIV